MASTEPTIPAYGIDHLVYASSTLELGMDEVEAKLGVRPVVGGRHPNYGTRNALLSLGPGTYLEVIARDPDLPAPPGGALVDLPAGQSSRLITWVWRVADLQAAKKAADRHDVGLGEIQSGSRRTPDGSELRWMLSNPFTMPMGGVIPFLINWGETTHPSLVMPQAGRLEELTIRHPEPDRIRGLLDTLDVPVDVQRGEHAGVSAIVATATGRAVL